MAKVENKAKLEDYDVIRYPLYTEKTNGLVQDANTYTFCVGIKSTKTQVKEAIERIFNVEVDSVRVCNYQGKLKRVSRGIGRRPKYKKAYVTLKEGSKIELVEGL